MFSVMKPTEKAKEEAMKLLKSGVISFDNKKKNRNIFKRRLKVFFFLFVIFQDVDEEDSMCVSVRF